MNPHPIAAARCPMLADHAIFTSLSRAGRSGYHLVSRSPGITEAVAAVMTRWSPSDALILDRDNPSSISLYPLPDGRIALARTCPGASEYSRRGGRQLYTHILALEPAHLAASGHQPFALLRDALAQGHLHYHADPPPSLRAVPLGQAHPAPDREQSIRFLQQLGHDHEDLTGRLRDDQPITLHHPGARLPLAEAILALLPPEVLATSTVSTSLEPSAARPCLLTLLP